MLKLLPTTYFLVPAFAYILLLFGCGADETVNTPLAENGATDITPAPTSSPYFPVTLGNHWTYRNPDGSEWSREVAESQIFDAELYHSYSYEPPIKLDSLGAAEYLAYSVLVNEMVYTSYHSRGLTNSLVKAWIWLSKPSGEQL